MFLEFLVPLVKYFTPLNVFNYLTFRSAYAALTTLLICFLFGGKIIEALKRLKLKQSVRSDGPASHLVKTGTPTMGGIFIIGAVVVSMLLWVLPFFHQQNQNVLGILLPIAFSLSVFPARFAKGIDTDRQI